MISKLLTYLLTADTSDHRQNSNKQASYSNRGWCIKQISHLANGWPKSLHCIASFNSCHVELHHPTNWQHKLLPTLGVVILFTYCCNSNYWAMPQLWYTRISMHLTFIADLSWCESYSDGVINSARIACSKFPLNSLFSSESRSCHKAAHQCPIATAAKLIQPQLSNQRLQERNHIIDS